MYSLVILSRKSKKPKVFCCYLYAFFAVERLSDVSRLAQTILLAFVHEELLLKNRNKSDYFINFILRSIFDITIFGRKITLEKYEYKG